MKFKQKNCSKKGYALDVDIVRSFGVCYKALWLAECISAKYSDKKTAFNLGINEFKNTHTTRNEKDILSGPPNV